MMRATGNGWASFVARELGFSLGEARQLLGLASGHRLTCHAVKALTERHIADIRRKVNDLKRLERVVDELASRCHGNEAPDCPILEPLGAAS
jgi:MerR family mercuric resistance operon transcriptional regulator